MARTLAAGLAAVAVATLASACGAAAPATEAAADATRHADRERGLAVRVPPGWTVAEQPLTNVVVPRELVALATFPLRGGGKGGGHCALEPELMRMPADGALIRLLEYRPLLGDVWADLQRSSFPPQPARFRLTRAELERGTCGTGLGYTTTFSAADRPLHLWLAFGTQVSEARLREVEQILDSLELTELLPPPPDPYAGWPLVTTNPGDSLRPPPGWAGTAAMFPPADTPRPRPLFFASNRPLPGLPSKLVPYVEQLPSPWPEEAITKDFPGDGVLLWVLEEEKGRSSEDFSQMNRHWPRADDFRPARTCSPRVCWLRAAGSWQGYRFSVWIAFGPEATTIDRELARKSAASLAVSGCWRDQFDDCPDG